jgi:hypothetical protein
MRTKSLNEVLEHLKVERAEAERRLINLDISISTLMSMGAVPAKPPLFVLVKSGSGKEGTPTTREAILQALEGNRLGMMPASIMEKLPDTYSKQTVYSALSAMLKEGSLCRVDRRYLITSARAEDPAQAQAG